MKNLTRFARVTLLFLLGVVLWGAYVRASGSGAGCGSHWPLCNGEILPISGGTKTFIEFTHRVTSGVSLILCVALGWSTFKYLPRGSFSRIAGVATVVFILTEALLGAGLVLLELVDENKSMLRALSLGVHLLNTFLLIGSVSLVGRWVGQESKFKLQVRPVRANFGLFVVSVLSIFAFFALGSSGAMTALGDTLFPSTSVVEGLKQDLSPTSHFLIQLRMIHPVLAVLVSSFLLFFSLFLKRRYGRDFSGVSFVTTLLAGALTLQLLLGGLNILLLAPTALQLAHLFLADVIWLLLLESLVSIWVVPLAHVMDETKS